MKFLPKWATNLLYATGPKAGSASKIAPVGIKADGIQPGTGQKISAEEMNYILAALVDQTRLQAVNALRMTPVDSTKTYKGVIAFDPKQGSLLVDTSRVVYALNESGSVRSEGTLTLSAGTLYEVDSCTSLDVASSGPGVYFAGFVDDTTDHLAAWYYVDGVPTKCASTVAATGGFGSGYMSAAYDETNGAAVVAYMDTVDGVGPIVARIADAATPDLVAPTVGTFPTNSGGENPPAATIIASGGGVSLLSYASGATTWSLYKSTDGGDNWASITAPASMAANDDVLGIFYVEDFLNEGGAFVVAARRDATNSVQAYYSQDGGASWTDVGLPTIDVGTFCTNFFAIGNALYFDREGLVTQIYDALSGTIMSTELLNAGLAFNGLRFFSSTNKAVSGLLDLPVTEAGGRF